METTSPKPFVFVVMPFHEDFRDIYEVGIKQACIDAGAYCERVDEQLFNETIHERVYNQIAKADVIVAEMTGRNPNVFYEVGYAHALNKQVLLLTQKAEDIPFDLKHYPHIIYGGKITTLKLQLETKLRWCVENPKTRLADVDFNLEFYIDDLPVIDGTVVRIKKFSQRPSLIQQNLEPLIDFIFHVHNLSSKVITEDSYVIKLLTPESLITEQGYGAIKLPDGYVHTRIDAASLFPDEWRSIGVRLRSKLNPYEPHALHLTIRAFTPLGKKDFPFILNLPVAFDDNEQQGIEIIDEYT